MCLLCNALLKPCKAMLRQKLNSTMWLCTRERVALQGRCKLDEDLGVELPNQCKATINDMCRGAGLRHADTPSVSLRKTAQCTQRRIVH